MTMIDVYGCCWCGGVPSIVSCERHRARPSVPLWRSVWLPLPFQTRAEKALILFTRSDDERRLRLDVCVCVFAVVFIFTFNIRYDEYYVVVGCRSCCSMFFCFFSPLLFLLFVLTLLCVYTFRFDRLRHCRMSAHICIGHLYTT